MVAQGELTIPAVLSRPDPAQIRDELVQLVLRACAAR
jgi:hypothetical protein